MKPIFKRLLSGVLSLAMTASAVPIVAANAEESTPLYPYAIFAGSESDGAITINADNVCVNGNIATKGTISTNAVNFNVNGISTEHSEDEMIYFFKKLDYAYFNSENIDTYLEDYYLKEQNININTPLEAEGNVELVGNINISSGIKALDDVILEGNVENSNNSVICSKTGDILINTENVNLNGIVYAPDGCINITAQNLNINGAIMIADTICITCPNLNTNYSSSMAEFIGTESEVDLDVVAYGEYLSDLSAVDIQWYSTIPNGNFDIQISDNNEDYITIGTVSNANYYQYTILEDFTQKYIRVVETTYYGESLASIPFIIIQSEDEYQTVLLDSDEDGLPDVLEDRLETNQYKADTDEDGLSDYYEYLITKTDPLIFDSVTNGMSDADADSDEDGVSNIDEINNKIDPLNPDTDGDGLSDYHEINIYLTDPANIDSDKDSVEDGAEINIGLDPNNPETFGVPDSEYKVPQSIAIDNPMLLDINTEESPYEISIDVKTNFDVGKELSIVQSGYSYSIQNDAMIGASLDISISDKCAPENIVIKYNIKEGYRENTLNLYSKYEELNGLNRLNIFKYDKEAGMLLPIDTLFDEKNNTLYAEVDELGTYCIMDMEIWFNNLGVTVPIPEPKDSNSTPTFSPKSDSKKASTKSSSSWIPVYVNTPIDLVFILQSAGTSNKNFDTEKELIQKYASYVFKNYENVNVVIITFNKTTSNILRSSSNDMYLKNNVDVYQALSKINYKYEPDYCDREQAFSQLLNNNILREDTDKFVYKLVNGKTTSYLYNEHFNIINGRVGNYSEIFPNGWHYEDFSYGASVKGAIERNENLFVTLGDNTFSKLTEHLEGKLSPARPVYEVIVPTKWKKIAIKEELSPYNGIDTDGDTLTDWEEVDTERLIWNEDGNFEIPTFNVAELVNHLTRFQSSDYDFLYDELINKLPRHYLPILSDPSIKDSDGDTLSDEEEYYLGTDALKWDTDGDGLSDGTEVELWFDPTDVNPDGDSYNDKEERDNGTSPYAYNMTAAEKGEAFLRGGLLGDFETADDIETLCGQIAFSFVPFVADGRDYFANIFVNLDTKAALLNLSGFLLDLVPGVGSAGDAAKAFPKLSRFIGKYADDAPKVAEAIVQGAKEFPHSDEVIKGVAKILPAGAIDDVCDSIKNGGKLTKADYKQVKSLVEATDKVFDVGTSLKPQKYLDELLNSGKKFNFEEIVAVTKKTDGKLVWLEIGKETGKKGSSGLKHIEKHAAEFADVGIKQEELPEFIMTALSEGKVIGTQGSTREVYEVVYKGKTQRVAIEVGSNGYIVGANPNPNFKP